MLSTQLMKHDHIVMRVRKILLSRIEELALCPLYLFEP
jgi:hypothetical protein